MKKIRNEFMHQYRGDIRAELLANYSNMNER
jgi:hypothetical protein